MPPGPRQPPPPPQAHRDEKTALVFEREQETEIQFELSSVGLGASRIVDVEGMQGAWVVAGVAAVIYLVPVITQLRMGLPFPEGGVSRSQQLLEAAHPRRVIRIWGPLLGQLALLRWSPLHFASPRPPARPFSTTAKRHSRQLENDGHPALCARTWGGLATHYCPAHHVPPPPSALLFIYLGFTFTWSRP